MRSKVFRLIEALEDSDDVQNVFGNFDVPDDVLAELDAADAPLTRAESTARPLHRRVAPRDCRCADVSIGSSRTPVRSARAA